MTHFLYSNAIFLIDIISKTHFPESCYECSQGRSDQGTDCCVGIGWQERPSSTPAEYSFGTATLGRRLTVQDVLADRHDLQIAAHEAMVLQPDPLGAPLR